MATYIIESPMNVLVSGRPATFLKVKFGEESHNDRKVIDADEQLTKLDEAGLGGELVLVNGPASLPVAMTIAHHLAHRFGAVACFDPKPNHYVVAIAHGGERKVGDVIPAADVVEG